MPYAVTFTPAGEKSLEKLDRQLILRIKAKVLALAENPRLSGSIKLEGATNLFRIRVGDYRIVYAIDDRKQQVVITIVANRRDVYRGL